MSDVRGQFERAVEFIESLTPPDNWQAVLLAFMRMLDEKNVLIKKLQAELDRKESERVYIWENGELLASREYLLSLEAEVERLRTAGLAVQKWARNEGGSSHQVFADLDKSLRRERVMGDCCVTCSQAETRAEVERLQREKGEQKAQARHLADEVERLQKLYDDSLMYGKDGCYWYERTRERNTEVERLLRIVQQVEEASLLLRQALEGSE